MCLCVCQGRDHLTPEKQRFAHEHAQMKSLEDVVEELKPTAIIGSDVTLLVHHSFYFFL